MSENQPEDNNFNCLHCMTKIFPYSLIAATVVIVNFDTV